MLPVLWEDYEYMFPAGNRHSSFRTPNQAFGYVFLLHLRTVADTDCVVDSGCNNEKSGKSTSKSVIARQGLPLRFRKCRTNRCLNWCREDEVQECNFCRLQSSIKSKLEEIKVVKKIQVLASRGIKVSPGTQDRWRQDKTSSSGLKIDWRGRVEKKYSPGSCVIRHRFKGTSAKPYEVLRTTNGILPSNKQCTGFPLAGKSGCPRAEEHTKPELGALKKGMAEFDIHWPQLMFQLLAKNHGISVRKQEESLEME